MLAVGAIVGRFPFPAVGALVPGDFTGTLEGGELILFAGAIEVGWILGRYDGVIVGENDGLLV